MKAPIAHIVYALLMHTQIMSESNENRETPITCITTCSICRPTLHGINRPNTSTIVCKCSDNLFQTNVYIKCNLDISHTRMHTYTRQETWREVALGGKNTISTPGWRDEWLGDNSTDLRLPAGAAKFYSDSST